MRQSASRVNSALAMESTQVANGMMSINTGVVWDCDGSILVGRDISYSSLHTDRKFRCVDSCIIVQ